MPFVAHCHSARGVTVESTYTGIQVGRPRAGGHLWEDPPRNRWNNANHIRNEPSRHRSAEITWLKCYSYQFTSIYQTLPGFVPKIQAQSMAHFDDAVAVQRRLEPGLIHRRGNCTGSLVLYPGGCLHECCRSAWELELEEGFPTAWPSLYNHHGYDHRNENYPLELGHFDMRNQSFKDH